MNQTFIGEAGIGNIAYVWLCTRKLFSLMVQLKFLDFVVYTLPLNLYHFKHKCRIFGCEITVVALSTFRMNEDHITPDAQATVKNQ